MTLPDGQTHSGTDNAFNIYVPKETLCRTQSRNNYIVWNSTRASSYKALINLKWAKIEEFVSNVLYWKSD